MINLSSIADIIYSKKYIIFSKKDNAEKTDIIYLKSGKQIEGRAWACKDRSNTSKQKRGSF